jgi:hypothetical protein
MTEVVLTAVADARRAAPPGAWRAVVRAIEAESRTLAAMLEQHGALGEPGPDGAVPVLLREAFVAKIDAPRLAKLEAAVRGVLGADVRVRLQAMAPAGL